MIQAVRIVSLRAHQTRSFHVEQAYLETLEACPVCGGGEWRSSLTVIDRTASSESFTLKSCSACGFLATNPRPDRAHIGHYYDSPDYISHTNTKAGLQDRIYQWVRRRAIRNKHRLIARHRTGGRVLDVGCGTGEFLAYLKSQGYLSCGVEPGIKARELAIAEHALEVFPALEQVPALEQFHVVSMWHVLEHVHDVRDTLKKVHARLAHGGLFVVAVPDRDSWDAGHYGADWAAYDVPRHLSHFRRQDVHRLLGEHGFKLLDTRSMWFDAPYVSMLSEKYRGAGPVGALLRGTILGTLSNLVALSTPRPTSSSLYLAEKA